MVKISAIIEVYMHAELFPYLCIILFFIFLFYQNKVGTPINLHLAGSVGVARHLPLDSIYQWAPGETLLFWCLTTLCFFFSFTSLLSLFTPLSLFLQYCWTKSMVTFVAINVKGLKVPEKRAQVLRECWRMRADIVFLQETHFTHTKCPSLKT